ncbi:MAG: hypothetical protein M9894_27745 [Planctomycetes bacterium]|nr:hypothetical protein [Planctomycetota bacterium]
MGYGRFDDQTRGHRLPHTGTTTTPGRSPAATGPGPTAREPDRAGATGEEWRRPAAARMGDDARRTRSFIAGGSLAEAVCGGAVVVMAVLGLANVGMPTVAFAGTIVLGAALLLQSGAFAARYRELTVGLHPDEETEVGGGLSAQMIGGIAGILLGVLAILGVAPAILTPVAIIVFGAALLLGGSLTLRVGEMAGPAGHDRTAETLRRATESSAGAEALIGMAAVVLGVLAVIGVAPETLVLVSLLALGAGVLLSGGALGGRAARTISRGGHDRGGVQPGY